MVRDRPGQVRGRRRPRRRAGRPAAAAAPAGRLAARPGSPARRSTRRRSGEAGPAQRRRRLAGRRSSSGPCGPRPSRCTWPDQRRPLLPAAARTDTRHLVPRPATRTTSTSSTRSLSARTSAWSTPRTTPRWPSCPSTATGSRPAVPARPRDGPGLPGQVRLLRGVAGGQAAGAGHGPAPLRGGPPGGIRAVGGALWLRATSGARGRGALAVHDHDTARSWLELHKGWGSFTAAELLEPDSITWMSDRHAGELVSPGPQALYWELSRISPSGVDRGHRGRGNSRRPGPGRARHGGRAGRRPPPQRPLRGRPRLSTGPAPQPDRDRRRAIFTTHSSSRLWAEPPLRLPEARLRGAGPPFPRPLNPAPEGMVWNRGVDFEPVLAPAAEIDRHVAALEELRRALHR